MTDQPGSPSAADVLQRAWRVFDVAASDWLLGLINDEQIVAAAMGALATGCNSPSLLGIAALRAPDQGAVLSGVFGTCQERDIEFPLSHDAIKRSGDDVLARMLEGSISPRDASIKLWSLADRDRDGCFPKLQEFRNLAISLDLAEEPDCDFELDLDEWRLEMLTLARETVSRGGTARYGPGYEQ
jgi:hypothetical protein